MDDFRRYSRRQIEDLVIDGNDLNVLYRIDIFLDRQQSDTYVAMNHETQEERRNELKKKLSWTKNMIDICKRREDDLRTDHNKFNWAFRVEAQKLLPPQLYDQIAEAAKKL